MPRPTRRLSPQEIAQIWARNVLAVRTQSAVDNFNQSRRDHQASATLRIAELVKLLPDQAMPSPQKNILVKQGCSPSQEPNRWVSDCLARRKYVLLGSFVEKLLDPKLTSNKGVRDTVLKALSSHFTNNDPVSEEARNVARLAVFSLIEEVIPYTQVFSSGNMGNASVVGSVCSLVVAGDCADEVFERIPPANWKRLFDTIDSLKNSESLADNFTASNYRVVDKDRAWMISVINRALLMDVAAQSRNSDQSTQQELPQAPRRSRPAM